MIKHFITVILGMSLQASAGEKVGNGGKVIACLAGNSETLQIVDFYEAEILRGWKLQAPQITETPEEMAREVLKRIKTLNPTRYHRLLGFLSTFESESRFVYGQELVDISDSNHPSYPRDCQVKQLVIQREPTFAGDSRYLINGDFWNKMDMVNRAGMILHEIIYREQILVGIESSQNVRFFNSVIWANKLAGMTQDKYLALMKDVLPDIDLEDYNFAICRPGYVQGELNQCARREAPVFNTSPGAVFTIQGFILPSWSPLAQGKEQYFTVIDPKNKKKTEFLIYGPFSKNKKSFQVPLAAIRFAESALVILEDYAGYAIYFINNILPDFQNFNNGDYEREKLCYYTWECQPKELDQKSRNPERGVKYSWATLNVSPNRHLLRFDTNLTRTPPQTQVPTCGTSVTLFEDGRLQACNGFGRYEDAELSLIFDQTEILWDKNGKMVFAAGLKYSKLLFNKQWIGISELGWREQELGIRFISLFKSDQEFYGNLLQQRVKFPAGIKIYLNANKEITSLWGRKESPFEIKLGNKKIKIFQWRDQHGEDPRVPHGLYRVQLSELALLKNTQGVAHKYLPNSILIIDSNGIVKEYINDLGLK